MDSCGKEGKGAGSKLIKVCDDVHQTLVLKLHILFNKGIDTVALTTNNDTIIMTKKQWLLYCMMVRILN